MRYISQTSYNLALPILQFIRQILIKAVVFSVEAISYNETASTSSSRE